MTPAWQLVVAGLTGGLITAAAAWWWWNRTAGYR